MRNFSDVVRTLPAVGHIERLELYDETERLVGVIENRPGSARSVAVYHASMRPDGRIDANAAEQALTLYAEHTADARAHPGKHPNIDRLLKLINENGMLRLRIVAAAHRAPMP